MNSVFPKLPIAPYPKPEFIKREGDLYVMAVDSWEGVHAICVAVHRKDEISTVAYIEKFANEGEFNDEVQRLMKLYDIKEDEILKER